MGTITSDWRRTTGATLSAAVLALAAAGCGGDDDSTGGADGDGDVTAGRPAGYEATPDFIGKVVDQSTGVPYRCELTVRIGGADERDMGTCASDGERTEFTFDLLAVYEPVFSQMSPDGEMPAQFDGIDWSMEQVADSTTTYVKAPMFDALSDLIPSSANLGAVGDMIDAFAQAGDGWGSIDNAAMLAELPEGTATQAAGGMDAAAFFEMLDATEEVDELGSDTIDGDTVSGLAAQVTLGDIYEGRGVDIEQLIPGASVVTDVLVPIEVWVDSDGHIRRIDMTIDADDIADAARDAGADDEEAAVAASGAGSNVITFSDYGDESISVELPTGAVDITEDAVDAMAQVTP